MDEVTLAQEWWADSQGKPVPFGDSRGVVVLYGIGSRVPASVAASLEAKALEQAPEVKAVLSAPANKARKPRGAAK